MYIEGTPEEVKIAARGMAKIMGLSKEKVCTMLAEVGRVTSAMSREELNRLVREVLSG